MNEYCAQSLLTGWQMENSFNTSDYYSFCYTGVLYELEMG